MHSSRLAMLAVLGDSLRAFGAALPALTAIAAGAGAALVAIAASVSSFNWGLALDGGSIDPRVLSVTLSGRDYLALGAGMVLALIPLSYAIGATVHAAAEPQAGLRASLRRVQAKGLQLFWLQWVVNILAARYSPWAGMVMWLGIAAAIPVGILENLGPTAAIERQHALAAGQRGRIYALVFALTLAAAVFPLTLGLAVFGGNPTGAALAPLARFALAVPAVTVCLVPAQFLLVVLSRAYLDLAGGAALHAKGAANVSS